MNNKRQLKRLETLQRHRRERTKRAGVIVVMTGFCLIAVFAFVALSVDAGRMVLTETKMQNACDAAEMFQKCPDAQFMRSPLPVRPP